MNLQDLLKRTNLDISFDQYLSLIQQNYPLIGAIKECTPIFEGYEDANFVLNTNKGKFALKIFAEFRTEKNIDDYANVIHSATDIEVRTLEIVPSIRGDLFIYKNVYCMITRYFEGTNFQNTTPTDTEILTIAESISKLNTLNFQIDESYDSWGNKNLANEYSNTSIQNESVKKEILPLIEYLNKQDFTTFSKGIIHGDMQRKHVLKNENQLCIIDYGCMSYDLKVYDLSTFLAWFCLAEDTWQERENIFNHVLIAYSKFNSLTEEEIKSLKPLIAASYAAYYLKTTELIEQGDNSQETLDWNTSSKDMFEKSMNWISL